MPRVKVVVVGAGAFGVTTALELSARGFEVVVVCPGPVPHPDAATTDLSKLVRADYGCDTFYTELMERGFARWRAWNEQWVSEGGRALFHETGFLLLASEPLREGAFEHDSFSLLSARGYPLERLDERSLARRFPVLRPGKFVDGYYNPVGGWAESGAVLEAVFRRARRENVRVEEGFRMHALVEASGRVTGVRALDGRVEEGDVVVVAAGTWTPKLVPELADRILSRGQPVFVFRPRDASPFEPPRFVPWAADIGRTGWYGFAANAEGLVKVANHGAGRLQDPDAPRAVASTDEARFRAFLRDALPSLETAPLASTRLCFYSDTFDGDFLIDRHPERPGLVVASGGSGHAFKFMPMLGELVADCVEGKSNPFASRFRWRELAPARAEQARCRE
jgi:sarcosine oxidase/L-pipecolate oxidase